MSRLILFYFLFFMAANSYAQCTKDTDCKGDRVCDGGVCANPSKASQVNSVGSDIKASKDVKDIVNKAILLGDLKFFAEEQLSIFLSTVGLPGESSKLFSKLPEYLIDHVATKLKGKPDLLSKEDFSILLSDIKSSLIDNSIKYLKLKVEMYLLEKTDLSDETKSTLHVFVSMLMGASVEQYVVKIFQLISTKHNIKTVKYKLRYGVKKAPEILKETPILPKQKTCAVGNAGDCYELGIMYENGDGVAKDSVKATALFKKACGLGYSVACNDHKTLYKTDEAKAAPTKEALEAELFGQIKLNLSELISKIGGSGLDKNATGDIAQYITKLISDLLKGAPSSFTKETFETFIVTLRGKFAAKAIKYISNKIRVYVINKAKMSNGGKEILDIFANSLLRSLVVKYINKVFGALASKYNMKLNKLKTSDLPIEEMVTYGQCVFTVTISNRKPSGKAWDAFNGAPDPFGTLIIQGKTYPITKRNNSHVISFTFTNMRSRLSMFKVSLMDKDVSNNDYIGNESFIWDGSKQGNMKQNSLSFSWHCVQ